MITPAEILNRAAEVIREEGWWKAYGAVSGPRVGQCLTTALAKAFTQVAGALPSERCAFVPDAAYDALADVCGMEPHVFNDRFCDGAEEALLMLKRARESVAEMTSCDSCHMWFLPERSHECWGRF